MGHERECWEFDGSTYEQVGDLSVEHGLGALAKYNGGKDVAVMIGGFDTKNYPARGRQILILIISHCSALTMQHCFLTNGAEPFCRA